MYPQNVWLIFGGYCVKTSIDQGYAKQARQCKKIILHSPLNWLLKTIEVGTIVQVKYYIFFGMRNSSDTFCIMLKLNKSECSSITSAYQRKDPYQHCDDADVWRLWKWWCGSEGGGESTS